MHYVYVIESDTGERYIGYTSDLKRRIDHHNSDGNTSTSGQSWTLVYYEAFRSKEDATDREAKLKKHGQAKRWLFERIDNSLSSDSDGGSN
jgi:putative endonuclease